MLGSSVLKQQQKDKKEQKVQRHREGGAVGAGWEEARVRIRERGPGGGGGHGPNWGTVGAAP